LKVSAITENGVKCGPKGDAGMANVKSHACVIDRDLMDAIDAVLENNKIVTKKRSKLSCLII